MFPCACLGVQPGDPQFPSGSVPGCSARWELPGCGEALPSTFLAPSTRAASQAAAWGSLLQPLPHPQPCIHHPPTNPRTLLHPQQGSAGLALPLAGRVTWGQFPLLELRDMDEIPRGPHDSWLSQCMGSRRRGWRQLPREGKSTLFRVRRTSEQQSPQLDSRVGPPSRGLRASAPLDRATATPGSTHSLTST